MLLEVQRLFVMMQTSDRRACSTEALTKSFGWNQGDGQQQQDAQEFNRVLFEAIEKALSKTPQKNLMDDMFFGDLSGFLLCHNCNHNINLPDRFMDMGLHVEGKKGVAESLKYYFQDDIIEQVPC